MGLFNLFDLAGSALSAQSVRLNTVASNLSNAQVASCTPESAYRAREPVFAAVMRGVDAEQGTPRLTVAGIVESDAPPTKQYAPHHPLADKDGYVYMPNVNVVEEMANMISTSRSYQSTVEVLNTSKQLLLDTLRLGRQA